MTRRSVACRVDLQATHDHFHAHVDLGDVRVGPGDEVMVHGLPARIPFGVARAFPTTADVEHAGPIRRLWTMAVGRFWFQDLYDVGFEG